MNEIISILWQDYLLAAKEYLANPSPINFNLAQAQFEAYEAIFGERTIQ